MQVKIKYWLFSFLIMLTAINIAVAEPVTGKAAAGNKIAQHSMPADVHAPNAGAALITGQQFSLTDCIITHTQVLQTGANLFGKRVQSDKDLLLLYADKFSKTVKASSCYNIKFADNLTHIFLYLFPYHFFW